MVGLVLLYVYYYISPYIYFTMILLPLSLLHTVPYLEMLLIYAFETSGPDRLYDGRRAGPPDSLFLSLPVLYNSTRSLLRQTVGHFIAVDLAPSYIERPVMHTIPRGFIYKRRQSQPQIKCVMFTVRSL